MSEWLEITINTQDLWLGLFTISLLQIQALFEHTCAYARWALMHHFLSVRLFTQWDTCLVCLKVQLLATFELLAKANSNVPKSAVIGLKANKN